MGIKDEKGERFQVRVGVLGKRRGVEKTRREGCEAGGGRGGLRTKCQNSECSVTFGVE